MKINVVDVNSMSLLVSALVIHTIGAQMVIIVPGFVQGLVEYAGFSDELAGYIASAEMWGTAAGSISMIFFVSRLNWKHLIFASLLILVVVNSLSMIFQSFYPLLCIRFCAGVAGGIIISLSYAILGLTKNSDRNFGLGIMFVLLYATALFAVIPTFFSWYGLNGLLGFLVLYSVLGLPFIKGLVASGNVVKGESDTAPEYRILFRTLGMAAMFFYFISTFGLWTYLYRIGVSYGLTEVDVGNSLSLSGMFGIAGAFSVAVIGSRFGRIVPVLGSLLISIFALILLFQTHSFFMFGLYACLFNFTWNMTHPFLLGMLATLARDGSMVVYGTAFQMLGTGMGPLAAAYIAGITSYKGVMWLSMVFLIACFVCVLPPLLAAGRANKSPVAGANDIQVTGT